ncbi:hypothetical protein ON010_g14305 [Phytophthora cinnamomi]|nr:hypothetical protein ON010_g14305 [Phytophthora cinnamomi]
MYWTPHRVLCFCMQSLCIFLALPGDCDAHNFSSCRSTKAVQAPVASATSAWCSIDNSYRVARTHAVDRTITISARTNAKGSQDLTNPAMLTYLALKNTQKQSSTMFHRLLVAAQVVHPLLVDLAACGHSFVPLGHVLRFYSALQVARGGAKGEVVAADSVRPSEVKDDPAEK